MGECSRGFFGRILGVQTIAHITPIEYIRFFLTKPQQDTCVLKIEP